MFLAVISSNAEVTAFFVPQMKSINGLLVLSLSKD